MLWCVILGTLGGFAVGVIVSVCIHSLTYVGTLRVDRSDPDEAPYLFLELEKGGFEVIRKSKPVSFKVKIEDYIPRK